MKQNYIATITACILCIIFGTTTFISCTKSRDLVINGTNVQPCKNVVCYNGGACVDGLCSCPIGFEGAECKEYWNARYTGNYTATDECNKTITKQCIISPIVNRADAILISNFTTYGNNINVEAFLNPDKTTMNIAPQRFDDSLYISGTATQTQSTSFINFYITARDTVNHVSKNCSILMRKN